MQRAYRLKDLERAGFIEGAVRMVFVDRSLGMVRRERQPRISQWPALLEKEKGTPRPVKVRPDTTNLSAPFVDEKTGSHWDIAGRAVEGELKGWTLQWMNGTQVKWFAWAAQYPTTSIYEP